MHAIETVFSAPLEILVPNEDNPRTITEAQFDKLVNSIIDFPDMLRKRPLVVVSVHNQYIENGEVSPNGYTTYKPLGGNMRLRAIPEAISRLQAALNYGSKRERKKSQETLDVLLQGVPVVVADSWTPEQRREFVIKDNVGYGDWDWEMIANQYEKTELLGWGLEVPSFNHTEKIVEAVEDEFEPVYPQIIHTEKGDIYELNGHRIGCGDSTDRFAVAGLMAGHEAHLTFTSPPYWVGKEYETQEDEEAIDSFIYLVCDGISLATGPDFGRVVINTGTASINRIDRKRKVEILPLIDKWQRGLRRSGWLLRHLRIWAKRGQLPASISPKTDVIDQHNEYIATFEQEWSQLLTYWHPEGEQRGQERLGTPWAQQGLWDDIHGEKSAKGLHKFGAAFPVELAARNLLLYTRQRESVYEPFLGSGTTLVAAEQLNRTCYGQDLDPGCVDVAVKRWVSWKRGHNQSYTVLRNGKDISGEAWLTEL